MLWQLLAVTAWPDFFCFPLCRIALLLLHSVCIFVFTELKRPNVTQQINQSDL